MIAYHCNANFILAEPFASRKDKHCLLANDNIMKRLSNNKLNVDLQILDNEVNAEYKQAITENWNANYQLLTPNTHWSSAAKRAIHTFKDHFLSILAGVASDFQ